MQYQTTDSFQDPIINFDGGVAAIDIITLQAAGKAIEPHLPSHTVTLPPEANYQGNASFEDLMQISVNAQQPSVSAIIDTKKMTWEEANNPHKTTFTDYTGVSRQGVSFSGAQVLQTDNGQLTRLPLKLYDGRPALMWFAELSLSELQQIGYYDLFNRARTYVSQFNDGNAEPYDLIKIPAQQIEYVRSMVEVLQLNPDLEDTTQTFKVALDDTGARVFVETAMLGRGPSQPMPEPKITVFGQHGPVLFWLTEPNAEQELTPFAVVATTSEAWLGPNQAINFDFEKEGATDVPSLAAITEEDARQKAENLLCATDPNYQGTFGSKTVDDIGYLFWQDVRGGGSMIVGHDGGVLFSNMTGSVSPEDLIQAYKEGKRTNESQFTTEDKSVVDKGVVSSNIQTIVDWVDQPEHEVMLSITNNSKDDLYLEPWDFPVMGDLEQNIFEFAEPQLGYVGLMAKRVVDPSKRVKVEPGETLKTLLIKLGACYEVSKMTSNTKIRYRAPGYLGADQLYLIESNWLTCGVQFDTVDQAKPRAYRYYGLENEDIRALHELVVKKEFPDGWAFELKARDPDPSLDLRNNFLLLGKDGTTSDIMPDGEDIFNQSNTVVECRELWQKQLYKEAMEKHGDGSVDA